jgi:TonB family protein
VKDFAFAHDPTSGLPKRSRYTYVIAVLFHIALFLIVMHVRTHPTRMASAGSPYGSMVAYVPGPVGAAPAAARAAEPKKPAMQTKTVKATAVHQDAVSGAVGTTGVGSGQGTGPVRLGSGGSLTLIKRVQPIYPPLMQQARVTGQVVLDAIIHADGTIGDIKVLSASNDAFAQSAINAVKQWQYTAPGFEGILTVTVNFNFGA